MKKRAAACSPALHRSTIGAGGLSFSVRNGKRRDPAAKATRKGMTHRTRARGTRREGPPGGGTGTARRGRGKLRAISSARLWRRRLYTCALSTSSSATTLKKRSSHLAEGFALRCIQRLSRPDADTRRCAWRHNRQTGGLSVTVLSY